MNTPRIVFSLSAPVGDRGRNLWSPEEAETWCALQRNLFYRLWSAWVCWRGAVGAEWHYTGRVGLYVFAWDLNVTRSKQ